MTTVKLTYFKQSGKYYTDEKYESSWNGNYDIYEEVREMQGTTPMPGLTTDAAEFYILIEPQSFHGVPKLLTPKEIEP